MGENIRRRTRSHGKMGCCIFSMGYCSGAKMDYKIGDALYKMPSLAILCSKDSDKVINIMWNTLQTEDICTFAVSGGIVSISQLPPMSAHWNMSAIYILL